MQDPERKKQEQAADLAKVAISGKETKQAVDSAQSLVEKVTEGQPTPQNVQDEHITSASIVDQARLMVQGSTVDGTFKPSISASPEVLSNSSVKIEEAPNIAKADPILKPAEDNAEINKQHERTVQANKAVETPPASQASGGVSTPLAESPPAQEIAQKKEQVSAAQNIYTGNVVEKGESTPITVTGMKVSEAKTVHTEGGGGSGGSDKPPEAFITKQTKPDPDTFKEGSQKISDTSVKEPHTPAQPTSATSSSLGAATGSVGEKASQVSEPVKNSITEPKHPVEPYQQQTQALKSEQPERIADPITKAISNPDVPKQPVIIEPITKNAPIEASTPSPTPQHSKSIDDTPRPIQKDVTPTQEPKIIDGGLSLESVRQRLLEQKLQDVKENIARPIVEQRLEKQESKPTEPRINTDRNEKVKTSSESAENSTQQRRNVEMQNTKQIVEATTTNNIVEVAKTMTKGELVKTITEAIKTAISEGKITKLSEIVKAAIIDPIVREAVKTVVQSSSGGSGSGKPGQVELAKVKATDIEKIKLPLDQAKSIDAITQPVTTKQEAMQVLLGLVVDASKLQNPIVQAVQAETVSKLQTIQSSIDELLKLRVEQFVALSSKAHGVDGATLKMLCNEALQELATRYGLTDEQRAMLSRIMVQLHETDFTADQDPSKQKATDPNELEKQNQKDLKQPEAKVLSKQELEKLFQEELVQLEEFLKERDEVKLKRAQEKLEALLQEVAEEGTNFVIDEDFEVIKTYSIEGIVVEEFSGTPIAYTQIYAGLLGKITTDVDGKFAFYNIPQDTAFMIGADKIGYHFKPELVTGTLQSSAQIRFIGMVIN